MLPIAPLMRNGRSPSSYRPCLCTKALLQVYIGVGLACNFVL